MIPCAVLEDGTRVLTQKELMTALGRSTAPMGMREGGNEHIPAILRGKSLKPFLSEDLPATSTPLRFIPMNGGVAYGYRAESLPKVCDVYQGTRRRVRLPSSCRSSASAPSWPTRNTRLILGPRREVWSVEAADATPDATFGRNIDATSGATLDATPARAPSEEGDLGRLGTIAGRPVNGDELTVDAPQRTCGTSPTRGQPQTGRPGTALPEWEA